MTNAYRHAKVSPGRQIRTRCVLNAGHLCVSVTDANDTLPTLPEAAPDDESGRGLPLVATLAAERRTPPRRHRQNGLVHTPQRCTALNSRRPVGCWARPRLGT
ncbi:ATP-binding protein [Streptomyces ureilyticus]|uniref:ATP-binding protein n=1 Tax=Streptomyces ureilyticus TaxID=1775131 RepID=UPI001F4869BB|nr:ATP-binding protein [Streptomyces ureilyticus]